MEKLFDIIYVNNNILIVDKQAEIKQNDWRIRFTNLLASLLPDDTKVIPMDNSAQGIFTIGDIKKEIKKNEYGTLLYT